MGAQKYKADLDPILSGMVAEERQPTARIALNSQHSAARRRFTWAQEIGHIVERASIASDSEYSFTDTHGVRYDNHVFFADEFAGALLMPEDELRRLEANGYTDGQLARAFGVSVAALDKRRERLAVQPSGFSPA